MDTSWKDTRVIIGSVAKGDCYYHRAEIVDDIWNELKKGNFVLIAAPRRVGKTSIMQYMTENPKGNYKMVFENIQGINSANELFKRIFDLILSCLRKSERAFAWAKGYLKSRNISVIDISGKIEIERNDLNYKEELNALIEKIDTSKEVKIVLLLDELPEILFKLYKNEKINEASSILNSLREWRQNSTNKNILFVLAGSVGIHYVVNLIEKRNAVLNDLGKIHCSPLAKNEIYEYIKWATDGSTVQYNNELMDYLADKIHYFVPYFINLMLNEINLIARKNNNPNISKELIDNAFKKVSINNDYFSDWKSRLKDYMPKKDYDFVNELLTHLAHKDELTLQIIYDKALKYEKTDNYMSFIDDLEKDGYITTNGNDKFIFVSPFLKAYWKHANPIYNG